MRGGCKSASTIALKPRLILFDGAWLTVVPADDMDSLGMAGGHGHWRGGPNQRGGKIHGADAWVQGIEERQSTAGLSHASVATVPIILEPLR